MTSYSHPSDNVKDMFNVIGMFPLEGMLETYGEDRQDDVWRAKSGWFYEWLLGRHTSIYYLPNPRRKVMNARRSTSRMSICPSGTTRRKSNCGSRSTACSRMP
ncbi:MAG: hypothetical protein NTW21_28080 [Verrucomicrobia bacterium]|nr:hypothetical protein [Verrucomicrobiota bacterium]